MEMKDPLRDRQQDQHITCCEECGGEIFPGDVVIKLDGCIFCSMICAGYHALDMVGYVKSEICG